MGDNVLHFRDFLFFSDSNLENQSASTRCWPLASSCSCRSIKPESQLRTYSVCYILSNQKHPEEGRIKVNYFFCLPTPFPEPAFPLVYHLYYFNLYCGYIQYNSLDNGLNFSPQSVIKNNLEVAGSL